MADNTGKRADFAGWAAPPLYSIYSAAKFGIRGFTEALRRETTSMGVHVSAIYPGSSPTEFQKHIGENRAKKRFSTPEWLRVTPEEVDTGCCGPGETAGTQPLPAEDHGPIRLYQFPFPGHVDRAQRKAFAPYHEQDLK